MKSKLRTLGLFIALAIAWSFVRHLGSALVPPSLWKGLVLLALFGFGLLLAYGGLDSYRKLRLLKKVAIKPIGSIPRGGLVHVKGKATGADRLTSPLTGLPCFYYAVMVEKWHGAGTRVSLGGAGLRSRPRSRWRPCLRDVNYVKFYLQDETGKVLIDPTAAEIDSAETFGAKLKGSCVTTISRAVESERTPSHAELIDYISRINSGIHNEMASRHRTLVDTAYDRTFNSYTNLPADPPPEGTEQLLRFTERCLLPENEYIILGTCTENADPQEPNARGLIKRVKDTNPFTISSKLEQHLERKTRNASLWGLSVGVVLLLMGALVLLAGH